VRSVRARLGADLRARWRSTLALVVVIGLAGGTVLATAAGARRTDTAYPRFLQSSRAEDVVLGGVDVSPDALALFRRLKRLPQVAAAAPVGAMIIFAEGTDISESHRHFARGLDTPYHFAGADRSYGDTIDRAKVIAGRRPDPASSDEVLVNRAMVRQLRLRVGGTFRGRAWSPAVDQTGDNPPPGVPVRLKVVGVGVFPSDVVPTADYDKLPIFYPTNGYYRAHPDLRQSYAFWLFRLERGARDVPAFSAATDRVVRAAGVRPDEVIVDDQSGRVAKVERAIRPQALALAGFALLTALASLLVVGQALSRQLSLDAVEHPTLRALGMTPRQLVTMALLRVGLIAGSGALLAVAVAVLASPLMPIGPARVAETHPGVEVNAAFLAIGFAAIAVLLLARSVWPARRAARSRFGVLGAAEIAGAERASRIANGFAGRGLPVPAVVGARMALESGRGRTAVPVRSALLGTAVAVAAVAGAFTFNDNLNRLVSTPRLYGWDWDINAGVGFFPLPKDVRDDLLAQPAVDGVAGAQFGSITIGGKDVPAAGIDQLGGAPVFPTLLDGRAPSRLDEIALGAKTLRRAHRRVGETVVVKANNANRTMHIVGRVVFPKFGGAGFSATGLGEGAALSAHLLGSMDETDPNAVHSAALIRFKPGVERAKALASVLPIINSGRFQGCPSALCVTSATSQRPGDLENYARVRRTPLVLAALLAVMALAALANTLVSSIRRRRRDLAILKTLGFLGRQVSATTAWQATTLAAAALVVGLPLGVAAGRATWLAFASQLGVAEDVRTPALTILLAVPATIVMANLIATIPAWAAARTRPALVLRTE